MVRVRVRVRPPQAIQLMATWREYVRQWTNAGWAGGSKELRKSCVGCLWSNVRVRDYKMGVGHASRLGHHVLSSTRGECGSSLVSHVWWWCRWVAAHHRMPCWTLVSARNPMMNWNHRLRCICGLYCRGHMEVDKRGNSCVRCLKNEQKLKAEPGLKTFMRKVAVVKCRHPDFSDEHGTKA